MIFETCKCGCTEFYMLQSISGTCNFIVNVNGEATDNSSMHDNLTYTDMRKHYRCCECDRRAKEVE